MPDLSDLYRDKWIACTEQGIAIRWYYLWGPKQIPYSQIRGAELVKLGLASGKGRIWGTANQRYWASLDPHRRQKELALILDLGRSVRPYLTPDDARTVAAIIKNQAGLADVPERGNGPVI